MLRNLLPKSLILVSLISLVISQAALASPPPTILPGSLRALNICSFGGGYGIAWTRSGDNGKFFSGTSSDLPPELTAFAGTDFVFRVCVDVNKATHYFARFSGPHDRPVCEVVEREIFRDPNGKVSLPIVYGSTNYNDDYVGISGWTFEVPSSWQSLGYAQTNPPEPIVLAQLADGPCPAANDSGYAHVTNVPPALFKGIVKAFRERGNPALGFRSVRCSDTGCSAFLSNDSSASFDVKGDHVVLTKVTPWID
jgi:hypothetical protein